MAQAPTAQSWNAKCNGYRDLLSQALTAAGRELRPDQVKHLQAAGGFMAENNGEVGAALGSAMHCGHPASDVLAAYRSVLRAQPQQVAA